MSKLGYIVKKQIKVVGKMRVSNQTILNEEIIGVAEKSSLVSINRVDGDRSVDDKRCPVRKTSSVVVFGDIRLL